MRLLAIGLLFLLNQFAKAQNFDLTENKQWNQLMQLNPSMTAIGGEFRTIMNDVGGINLGLESPLFKKRANIGLMYQRAGLSNLTRDRLMAVIGRKKEFTSGNVLRIGVNANWNRLQLLAPSFGGYALTDFSGNRYLVDSTLHAARSGINSYIDAGIGLSFERKNLIFGLDARQLSKANISPFNGIENRLKPQLSAQLGGFFGKKPDQNWFPKAVYSLQNGEQYAQFGLSHIRKHLSISGISEFYNGNTTLAVRFNFKKGRFFLSLEYADEANAFEQFELQNLRYVFNFSILKNKETGTALVESLRMLY
jgi:hypothetical protein